MVAVRWHKRDRGSWEATTPDGAHLGWVIKRLRPVTQGRSYATAYVPYHVARLPGGRTIGGHHKTAADAKRALRGALDREANLTSRGL